MDLLEHEAKELFAKYGISVPQGLVLSEPRELDDARFPAVVKAQVPVGGRGKAGGIKFAMLPRELFEYTNQLLDTTLHGFKVRQVLIEERLNIKRELYLGITIDRSVKLPVALSSRKGGVNIEDVPERYICKCYINPLIGIQSFMVRDLVDGLKLNKAEKKQVAQILRQLYRLFSELDATLVEINPLVLTVGGKFVAGDAKITLDDDALYRHKEFVKEDRTLSPLEGRARELGIALVQLDGNIGVIANGAGLTMATLDVLNLYNGKPGVFLDLGGGASPKRVEAALALMKDAKPKVILLNIFGGITRCDDVATGVRNVIEKKGMAIPIVARIKGTNEREGREILEGAGLIAATSLEEAVEKTVALS